MTKDDDGLERLQQLMTADKKSMYFECPKYLVNGLIKQLAARDERIRELEQHAERERNGYHQDRLTWNACEERRTAAKMRPLEDKIEKLEQQLKAAQERLAEVEQHLDVANAHCADCDNVEALKERLAEAEQLLKQIEDEGLPLFTSPSTAAWEYFAKHSPSSAEEHGESCRCDGCNYQRDTGLKP